MDRRTFILNAAKALGMVAVSPSIFSEPLRSSQTVPLLPNVVRQRVTFTASHIASMVESDFRPFLSKALSEAEKRARLMGWEFWDKRITEVTPPDLDAIEWEVVLFKIGETE